MRNVIFVAPFPAEITMRFARAVAKLEGVRLLGVVHTPPKGKDARLYADRVQIENPTATSDIIAGVGELIRRHGKPHRILGILEAIQVQLAEARAHFGIDGTPVRTAELFRDKARMKAALTKAGLPVARSKLITTAADARAFIDEVGFPMVLKPPAGMGAKSTFRVKNKTELNGLLDGLSVGPKNPILAEEFLRGREFSFETLTVGGKVQMHSISHYLPTCLEAVENPWIQWCCMLPRDISSHEYDGARDIGFRAISALGLKDGMTHMEWFQRPDGSFAIGEIAQRPPGANISLMTGVAHDRDIYRAWARAVVDGAFDGVWNRQYAVGSAFLRGMGRGHIAGVTGVKETIEVTKGHVVEAKLPTVGAMKSDSYEGDGYVVVKDRSTDVVKALLNAIINRVRVHYA
jgi:D-alanine-D-alanine ligase-like ATP-grasp enzyme